MKKTVKVKFSSDVVVNTFQPDSQPVEEPDTNLTNLTDDAADDDGDESSQDNAFLKQIQAAKGALKSSHDSPTQSKPRRSINVGAAVRAKPGLFGTVKAYSDFFATKDISSAQTLDFAGLGDITDYHFFFWSSYDTITTLNISYCANVSDLGVAQIARGFPSLETLSAVGCRLITEASISYLLSKCSRLSFFNADMTSVRYLAVDVDSSKLSVRNCPLLIPQNMVPSITEISSEVRTFFTWCKVVIVKTSEMRNSFIGPEILPPDDPGAATLTSPVCSYRSGVFRVVELTEDAPVELFLSENCLIVLPFLPGPFPPFSSVECRFSLVASFVSNFKALCIPVIKKKNDPHVDFSESNAVEISEDSPLDNPILNNMAKNFMDKVAGEKTLLSGYQRLSITSYSPHMIPDVLSSKHYIRTWLEHNQPHGKLLTLSSAALFHAYIKQKVFVKPIVSVDHLAKVMSPLVSASCSWASFAEILSETGNAWLEPSDGFDGPSHGPAHLLFDFGTLVRFICEFTSAKDITPSQCNVTCVNEFTHLCSVDRLKRDLGHFADDADGSSGTGNLLTEAECDRLLSKFEARGIGVIRRSYALSFANLLPEPPVPLDHLLSKNHATLTLRYSLNCRPSAVFHHLITVLSNLIPPTLLWRTGMYFEELSTLGVALQVEDHYRHISVRFYGNVTNDAVKESCSLFHTIIAVTLCRFSTANFYAIANFATSTASLSNLGDSAALRFIAPTQVSHHIKEFDYEGFRPRTFSREFDKLSPRCENCLLDVKLLSRLQSMFLYFCSHMAHQIVKPFQGLNSPEPTFLKLPLACAAAATGVTGYPGQSAVSAEIVNLANVAGICVYIGGPNNSQNVLKLTVDSGNIVAFSSVGSSSSERASQSKLPMAFGIRVAVFRLTNGGVRAILSTNGYVIMNESFVIPTSYITLVLQPSETLSPASDPTIIFARTDSQLFVSRLGARIGMRLEAVDPKIPEHISAATITEISAENGNWLVSMDTSDKSVNTFWADPSSSLVYPCGFMQYIGSDPNKMTQFQDLRQCNVKTGLQSSKSKQYTDLPLAFPWMKYIDELREDSQGIIEPVPYECFNKSNLLGFPADFLQRRKLAEIADAQTLTKTCYIHRMSVLKNASLSFMDQRYNRSLLLVPLPQLTWLNCCYPTFATLIKETAYPHFLCGYFEMVHFVDESPVDLKLPNFPIHVRSATTIATLLKMIEQPRFVPDECKKVFPNIQGDCEFPSYITLNSKTLSKAEVIEAYLRFKVFPVMLDYLTLHEFLKDSSVSQESTEEENKFDGPIDEEEAVAASTRTFVYRTYRACMTAYESFLRGVEANARPTTARRNPVEKSATWKRVTMPDAPCKLLLMSEAEKDFYTNNEDCSKLLCGQHAYHFINFYKAATSSQHLPDEDNELSSMVSGIAFGNFHDTLLTTYFCKNPTSDAQLLVSLHPYVGHLFMGRSLLETVPPQISALKFLRELILSDNNLVTLPAELEIVAPTLLFLDISSNLFSVIPDVVYNLTSLESLRANYLRLTNLDDRIGNLRKLRMLSLRCNCLTQLPDSLSQLGELEILDLSALPVLPISEDSIFVEEVVSFFRENHYSDEALELFGNFQEFLKVSTAIDTKLDRKDIGLLNSFLFDKVPRLQSPTFPPQILSLTKLQELSLANQALVSVPEDIGKLTALRRLDLYGCYRLQSISPQISVAPLEALRLNECVELKTPPVEIRKRGFAATVAFFRRLAVASVKCQRTKLMFVGLGGAGKTSLAWALMNKKPTAPLSTLNPLPVTDGIDIAEWKVETTANSTVEFRVWDFAGQVVYYNTHQFFLSHRAIYLIMWNVRLGHEYAGLDFWLSSIACHAPSSPVLVIGTHVDEVSQERSFLPEANYRKRFGNIRGFHYVSSLTGQGIEPLQKHIVELALAQKHMGEEIPSAWMTFEQKLTSHAIDSTKSDDKSKTKSSVMMISDVRHLSDASGIYEEEEVIQALQFLSDVGSLQYFRTDFLSDRVIVNPQWIVDVMACIVSIKESPIKDGHLLHSDIPKLWNKYSPDFHSWLLKLTEAFDLTFPIDGSTSIVPCLLPENAPESIDWPSLEDNLDHRQMRIAFSFRYLPTGLFNRAQVRLQTLSDTSIMWRRGSLLRKNSHVALITQVDSTTLQIKVQGSRPENLSFLILEVFDSLLTDSFNGLQPELLFSCPECVNLRVNEPSMFERSRIRRATELHIPAMQCFHFFHQVPTHELRLLSPAQSTFDFDYQLARTLQELKGLSRSFQSDVIIVGCPADSVPTDDANMICAATVAKDIDKLSSEKLNVITVPDPSAMPSEQLSILIRSTRVLVCCVSPDFMANEQCLAPFLYGHEILKKPLLVIIIREMDLKKYPVLAFVISDELFYKAYPRAKYKAADVAEAINQRSKSSAASSVLLASLESHPSVFLSYTWSNSKEAVDNGTRLREGALGVTDPRAIKRYIAEQGVDCWIDIEQVGRGGLFEDIAIGLRNAKVIVVCISDEYINSKNCLREFYFATTVCQLPVVMCAVGTGCEWKQSEVMLVASQTCRIINFQIDSSDNYSRLMNVIRSYVAPPAYRKLVDKKVDTNAKGSTKKPFLGKIGRLKSMTDVKVVKENAKTQNETISPENAGAVFREIMELGQGRFLRQVADYAQTSGSRSYPRLVIIDVVPTQSDELTVNENDLASNDEILPTMINKLQWCVRFLCECEDGWHPTDYCLPIPDNLKPDALIRQSGAYLGRVLSLARHGAKTPNLLHSKDSPLSLLYQNILNYIEKFIKLEESFDGEFRFLRETAIRLDQQPNGGDLICCQLTLGKELWLCSEHQTRCLYRTKTQANLGDGAGKKTTVYQTSIQDSGDIKGSFITDDVVVRRWAKRNSSVINTAADNPYDAERADLVKPPKAVAVSPPESPASSRAKNAATSSRACILQ